MSISYFSNNHYYFSSKTNECRQNILFWNILSPIKETVIPRCVAISRVSLIIAHVSCPTVLVSLSSTSSRFLRISYSQFGDWCSQAAARERCSRASRAEHRGQGAARSSSTRSRSRKSSSRKTAATSLWSATWYLVRTRTYNDQLYDHHDLHGWIKFFEENSCECRRFCFGDGTGLTVRETLGHAAALTVRWNKATSVQWKSHLDQVCLPAGHGDLICHDPSVYLTPNVLIHAY